MTHTPNTPSQSTQAFIYARISEDRDGESTAPERQVADARELIEREGLLEAGVYIDRDVSASKLGVTRPAFERLLVDVARAGGVIVAQDQDRLLRHPTDSERVLSLALQGARVRTVKGDTGTGELADAWTRFAVRMKAVIGVHESEHKAERHRRKHRETAEAGVGHGTRYRPFGHERDFTEHELEAPIVRELARRVLEGERIPSLCRDLNARGVLTTSGAPWRHTPLRKMLVQARLAGARELDGELIATGRIAPLITLDELAEVRAVLAMPRRSGTRTNARRHLLSGYLYCGVCGERLNPLPQARGLRYACPLPTNAHRPGCGKVSIVGAPVEAVVREAVLDVLDVDPLAELVDAEADQADAGAREALAELRAVDARRSELNADYADGVLERAEYRVMLARLDGRRREAEARFAELERVGARASLPFGEHAAHVWDDGDLYARREMLEGTVARIVVKPASKLGRVFDPSRVSIEWLE